MAKQFHLFHLVNRSPWPFFTACSIMSLLLGTVLYINIFIYGLILLFLGLCLTIYCANLWWRDIIREGTFEGYHTLIVQKGLKMGMILFIVSEIMFFFAFFWAYFHSSLVPVIEIGVIWPPAGIIPFNPWSVPFLNTLILLTSGSTITCAHYYVLAGNRKEAILFLELTILLACSFTLFQIYEYLDASFSISDGIYGSTFYMATGFHGLHVFIGTLMIIVTLLRLFYYQLTVEHHFGFEAAAWYWHFVDVVWLFLFISIYWWGSL